jgi:Polysaccharide lyase 14
MHRMLGLCIVCVAIILLSQSLLYSAEPEAEHENRIIDFNKPDQLYTCDMARIDFGKAGVCGYIGSDKTFIENEALKIKFRKNTGGSLSGIGFKPYIPERTKYTLQYRVKFHNDFIFTCGKLLGMASGGVMADACHTDRAKDGLGWTMRLMFWASSSGKAVLTPYVYHKDMTSGCGDFLGYRNGFYTISKNVWYAIKIEVVMNTGLDKNGSMKVWVDNILRFQKTDLRWATTENGRTIGRLLITTFVGAAKNPQWNLPRDAYIYFDNITWHGGDQAPTSPDKVPPDAPTGLVIVE